MNWTVVILVGVAVAAVLAFKRFSLVPVATARSLLRKGALVVDVRSLAEFQARSLPGAINLPLGDLTDAISRRVPDKTQVLLLHCLSGGRSAVAARLLKGLGYTQVYNLGSYGRAERIVSQP
jgi:phage shock protein E